MNSRRALTIAAIVVGASMLALLLFLTALSAQPPAGPAGMAGGPPGMPAGPAGMPGGPGMPPGGPADMPGGMPGMPGMPGGMAGAGATGAMEWSEVPGPPELSMTYSDFLAQTGLGRAPIPRELLVDAQDEPVSRTSRAWAQLYAIYARVPVDEVLAIALRSGATGSKLVRQMQEQLAVIRKENAAIEKAYRTVENGFWFEVGYPQYEPSAVTAEGTSVTVDVIMRVRPSLQQSLGKALEKHLKPYDNRGSDRQPFTFYTYQGGFYQPRTYHLHPSSVALWGQLWGATQLQLTLQDRSGRPVVTSTPQPINLGGNPTALVINPPVLRRTPHFEYVMPTEDLEFAGSRKLNLDYSKGWFYRFSFPLGLEDIARLHKASVRLIPAAPIEEAAPTAPTAVGPGMFPGMPAMPGMPGMPGMPPGGPAMPPGGPGGPGMPPGGPAMPPGGPGGPGMPPGGPAMPPMMPGMP